MRTQRIRARVVPRDLADYFARASRPLGPFNVAAHELHHGVKVLYYTTAGSLDTNPGTPIHALRGKRIVGVRLNCKGAPSGGSLEGDILRNDVSIFSSLDNKPTIPSGALKGYRQVVLSGAINNDDKVQCKINTISGATGPVVFEIFYVEPEI
jgi:hypothetical protein